jgi:hypothetical protein
MKSNYFDYRRSSISHSTPSTKTLFDFDILGLHTTVDDVTLETNSFINDWVQGSSTSSLFCGSTIVITEDGRVVMDDTVDVVNEANQLVRQIKLDNLGLNGYEYTPRNPIRPTNTVVRTRPHSSTTWKPRPPRPSQKHKDTKEQTSQKHKDTKEQKVRDEIIKRVCELELQTQVQQWNHQGYESNYSTKPNNPSIHRIPFHPPVTLNQHIITALSFQQKYILRFRFIKWKEQWKRTVQQKKSNESIVSFHSIQSKKTLFRTFSIWKQSLAVVQCIHRRPSLLLQRILCGWKQCLFNTQQSRKTKVVEAWRNVVEKKRVMKRVVRQWGRFVEARREERKRREVEVVRRMEGQRYLKRLEDRFLLHISDDGSARGETKSHNGGVETASPIEIVKTESVSTKKETKTKYNHTASTTIRKLDDGVVPMSRTVVLSNKPVQPQPPQAQQQPSPQPLTSSHQKQPSRRRGGGDVIKTDQKFLQALESRRQARQLRHDSLLSQKQHRMHLQHLEHQARQQQELQRRMEERVLIRAERERLEKEAEAVMEVQRIERQRQREKRVRADVFRRRKLLAVIIAGFKQHQCMSMDDTEKADVVYRLHLQSYWLRWWKGKWDRMYTARMVDAQSVFTKTKLRWGVSVMVQRVLFLKRQERISRYQHTMHTLTSTYHHLSSTSLVKKKNRKEWESMMNRKADGVGVRVGRRRWLGRWKERVDEIKEERWKEYRREEMRAVARV